MKKMKITFWNGNRRIVENPFRIPVICPFIFYIYLPCRHQGRRSAQSGGDAHPGGSPVCHPASLLLPPRPAHGGAPVAGRD